LAVVFKGLAVPLVTGTTKLTMPPSIASVLVPMVFTLAVVRPLIVNVPPPVLVMPPVDVRAFVLENVVLPAPAMVSKFAPAFNEAHQRHWHQILQFTR